MGGGGGAVAPPPPPPLATVVFHIMNNALNLKDEKVNNVHFTLSLFYELYVYYKRKQNSLQTL